MEARILPDGSVLTREWSPELAAALTTWEEIILATPRLATSTAAERDDYELREEQARVTFVTRLACELLEITGALVEITTRA